MITNLRLRYIKLISLLGKELKPYATSKRYRWGIILLLVIAPIAKHVYLLFPEEGFGDYIINNTFFQLLNTLENPENDWFYESFRSYFWIIGELLAPLILISGMFLLFPKNYYPAYLAIVPFGYYLTLFFQRTFFLEENNDFRDGFTISVTLAYMLFGIIFFVISDKIIIDRNSKRHAAEARIKGVINMPGVKWSEKEELIRKEVTFANTDRDNHMKKTA